MQMISETTYKDVKHASPVVSLYHNQIVLLWCLYVYLAYMLEMFVCIVSQVE